MVPKGYSLKVRGIFCRVVTFLRRLKAEEVAGKSRVEEVLF